MTTTDQHPTARQTLGGIAWYGVIVIGLAGFTFSFASLRELAIDCGLDRGLAWLLPVTLDASAIVAARVWLLPSISENVRLWARQWMLVALAVSIGGNIVEHAIDAHLIAVPWWAIAVVGAVPPAMLATVIHLLALVITSRQASATSPTSQPTMATWHQVTAPPAQLAQASATVPAGDFDELVERARQVVAANPAIGRGRLAAELDVNDHTARRVLERVRTAA